MRGRTLLWGGLAAGAALALARGLTWQPDPLADLYDRPKPLVYGHRGASKVAPENTLPAFQAALEQGADGVELDVQLSRDDRMVVIHDDSVDRTTNGHGRVRDMTFDELRNLDAGVRFGQRFPNARIPTLEEVLDLVGGKMQVNVEIKTETPNDEGLERQLVDLVRRLRMERQVIFSSFNPVAVWRASRLAPEIPIGMLYVETQPVYLRDRWLAPLVRPDAFHPSGAMATAEHVASAHDRGLKVNVWTVDDPAEVRRLMRLGVDGIITNRPDVVKSIRDGVATELGTPTI